jgi:hypothetical protein
MAAVAAVGGVKGPSAVMGAFRRCASHCQQAHIVHTASNATPTFSTAGVGLIGRGVAKGRASRSSCCRAGAESARIVKQDHGH